MEAFLHIGHPKTGSSFIQSFLALNFSSPKSNIYYPSNFRRYNSFDLLHHAQLGNPTPGNAFCLNKALINGEIEGDFFPDGVEKVILSSEMLFYDLDAIRSISGFLNSSSCPVARIVCFLPTVYDSWISSYAQVIKNHSYSGSFDFFVRESIAAGKSLGAFFEQLQLIRSVIPNANLIVLPYCRDGCVEVPSKSFINDVKYAFGIPSHSYQVPSPVNVSSSAEVFEALRLLNASNLGVSSEKIYELLQARDLKYATSYKQFYSSKANRHLIYSQHKSLLDEPYSCYFDEMTSGEVLCNWKVPPYMGEEDLRLDFHSIFQCISIVKELLAEP